MKRIRILLFAGTLILPVVLIGVVLRSQLASQAGGQNPTILAGRNVNMVAGTKLPFGDPWLQRQNEPSIAASTRNPMHLLGGGNDYRTVDYPDGLNLPGIERTASAGDAWLGVYESFDGGESWISTLLPGFPQDGSSQGQLSPLSGYQTACDPIVRAGANGLFYYCGIAFDHDKNKSAIFVARYVDDNNLEKVELKTVPNGTPQYTGPIQYIDTKLVATGSTSSSFIDMPNMAVDIPRGSARYGTIYVAYTVFSDTGASSTADQIFLQRSTDGGVTWSTPPVQLSRTGDLVQRPIIAVDPTDLRGNTVCVAFRRFSKGNVADGIEVVKSTDGGKTFFKLPDPAPSFYPFDQGTSPSPAAFRSNSYPTMAVGDLGTVYVAWSQRQGGPSGQARIMISALRKGSLTWTPAQVVDGTYAGIGHQFMPSLAFAAWKLMLAWYDQRDDVALDGSQFIADSQGQTRHTIDVRAAEGSPGLPPRFLPSVRLSRYLHVLDLDAKGKPIEEGGYYRVIQAEYNHINYPLFQLGTVPFHGDYLDVTPSVRILPPAIAFGYWIYNINPLEPTSFHAAWTDNRDVRPPSDGDWVSYNAPTSSQEGWVYPPPSACADGSKTGMRNQNIYTAHINRGLDMGSPGNTKQLDLTMTGQGGRTFVVFVKNTTDKARTLNLVLLEIGGVNASFDQFKDDNSLKVNLQPYSSASCTVYVDRSRRSLAPVVVNAFEGLKLVGYVVLNPDPTNLPLNDPNNPFNDLGNETHDPDVSAPVVWNYDLGTTSDPNAASMLSPRAQNPRAQNNGVVNPRAQNEGVLNPRAQNESIVNNEVANPRAQNTAAPNAALTDVTWTVTNEGNTTSVFTTNIRSPHPEYFTGDNPPLIAQVLVYKLHRVPVDKDCQLYETHQDELIANISNPRAQNPRAQNSPPTNSVVSALATTQVADLGAQDITFYLAPGEQAEVTLRVWDEDTTVGPTFSPDLVIAEAVAQAVNTADVVEGGTTPPSAVPPDSEPWTTPPPTIAVAPSSASFTATVGNNPVDQIISLQNSGSGTLNYTLSDDAAWLTVLPASGQAPKDLTLSAEVTGLGPGVYTATITIADPYATNNPVRIPVSLTVSEVTPVPSSVSLSGPARAGAGFISGPFTLTSLDQFGNVTALANDATFTLTSDSDGITAFFSAPDEKYRTSQIIIRAGTSSTMFYYRDTVPSAERLVTATCVSESADLGSAEAWVIVWPAVQQIVFESYRDGNGEIYAMNPDGTGLVNLTRNLATDKYPCLSHGGGKIAFVSDRDGNDEIYVMNADGSQPKRLTFTEPGEGDPIAAEEAVPAWSPDDAKIAFVRGREEIYVINANGTGEFRLTTDPEVADGYPSWSPDGTKIIFSSERSGELKIWTMNVDGTEQTVVPGLLEIPCTYPSWSPDGSRILFNGLPPSESRQIYVMNADGTGVTRLTFGTTGYIKPRWSPDGSQIIFIGYQNANDEIYVMNADGTGETRLTDNSTDDTNPQWAGGKIAMHARSGGRTPAIWIVNPDGSGLTRLTASSGYDQMASWSPDGTRIAFTRSVGGNFDIFVMNADGSGQVDLTNDEANDFSPCWSPDGLKIAFVSDRNDERAEIYSMNADGSSVTRLTNVAGGNQWPDWSPDGTKIAFAGGSVSQIYVMDVDGSNVTALTDNAYVNGGPRWSPDGTKIVYFGAATGDYEIYVMNADGSGVTRLTYDAGADSDPCWSPDGREIAFGGIQGGSNFDIYVMRADGSGLRRLTNLNGDARWPSWRTRGRAL
jgi:Tol biopolymer transport system component